MAEEPSRTKAASGRAQHVERYRGGRGMQSLDTKLKCWDLTSPPLPGWPQSPQGAGGKGVESRQTQAGAWLICLGLWLSRKACQSKTTGRKAWLLADVCGRQYGPLSSCRGPGRTGLSPRMPGRLQVAQDPMSHCVCAPLGSHTACLSPQTAGSPGWDSAGKARTKGA